MIDIALKEISKDFGGEKILNTFNLELKTGERIGLIGRNGCGKSTVLNMVTEKLPYDTGELSVRKNLKISYLKQSPTYQSDFTVKMVIQSAFSRLSGMATMIKQLEREMSEPDCINLEKLLEEHGELSSKFEVEGGYEITDKTDRICQGLKIDHSVLNRLFKTLSGGEKTTVELARVLLQNPDILLLDEPLLDFKGTILSVSHDRYFINQIANEVIELESGQLTHYIGNYDSYKQ
ncbi:MAG: ABC-F family ATP-binding cassette domain-containing protein [Deltaproteobacteria bacterium]|jgi:ATP-binding cassette, subfamily F, member 3|nr:ABC-F family ATP-binding cassette domain-containing protein [Deltaproteobacteria bacterium]MBT4527268.1 ABC-F family ATP-binding cassette domain-containing protein [Deltaproteobacteria bacterium]